jgi:hypothetical protein
MAGTQPTNNPFGLSEGDIVSGIVGIYTGWRVTSRPPNTKEVHLNILADFASPVGAIGVFVHGGGLPTGLLQVLHGVQNFLGLPGRPSADRRQTFAYLGDVVGIDAVTIAFDEECLWSIMSLAVVLAYPTMLSFSISKYIGSNTLMICFFNACCTEVYVP